MHNLLSRSQLNEWTSFENSQEQNDYKLNDYYECLIECDSLDQRQCKRICRSILD